jgi:hypothetical protein
MTSLYVSVNDVSSTGFEFESCASAKLRPTAWKHETMSKIGHTHFTDIVATLSKPAHIWTDSCCTEFLCLLFSASMNIRLPHNIAKYCVGDRSSPSSWRLQCRVTYVDRHCSQPLSSSPVRTQHHHCFSLPVPPTTAIWAGIHFDPSAECS